MPLNSSSGPLTLFDEIVDAARQAGASDLESTYVAPVLVVEAPQEPQDEAAAPRLPDADSTLETTGSHQRSASGRPVQRVVVQVVPSKFTANARRLAVGRSSVCEIILPFSAVSKVHAYLVVLDGGAWQIEDAGSTNGTMVNDAEVGAGKTLPLADTARISFGGVKAMFFLGSTFCAEVRRLAGTSR